MHRLLRSLFVAVCLVLSLCGTARAADGPERVTVGTYVNQVYGVDLKTNQFNVDFYIWFRWQSDDIKPLESFELLNGRISAKTGAVKKKLPNGQNYASCRVIANVTHFWDVSRFPLDDQVLPLEVEDGEHEDAQMVYVADDGNSGVSPSVQVPGWVIGPIQQSVRQQIYHTNYGDISLAADNESRYSRFVSTTPLLRVGRGRVFKVFFSLIIATLVSFLSFFVRPKDSSPRVGLCVGALFAAAASTFSLTTQLPDSNQSTMTERLIIVTLGLIFATCLTGIVSLNALYAGREDWVRKIDGTARWVYLVVYATLLAFYVR
jgi:hypothetical protein